MLVVWPPIVEPWENTGLKLSGLQYRSYVIPKVRANMSRSGAGVVQEVRALADLEFFFVW